MHPIRPGVENRLHLRTDRPHEAGDADPGHAQGSHGRAESFRSASGHRCDLATVYTGLGERQEALNWLKRAIELRAGFMLYLAIDPTFEALHAEPRFRRS